MATAALIMAYGAGCDEALAEGVQRRGKEVSAARQNARFGLVRAEAFRAPPIINFGLRSGKKPRIIPTATLATIPLNDPIIQSEPKRPLTGAAREKSGQMSEKLSPAQEGTSSADGLEQKSAEAEFLFDNARKRKGSSARPYAGDAPTAAAPAAGHPAPLSPPGIGRGGRAKQGPALLLVGTAMAAILALPAPTMAATGAIAASPALSQAALQAWILFGIGFLAGFRYGFRRTSRAELRRNQDSLIRDSAFGIFYGMLFGGASLALFAVAVLVAGGHSFDPALSSRAVQAWLSAGIGFIPGFLHGFLTELRKEWSGNTDSRVLKWLAGVVGGFWTGACGALAVLAPLARRAILGAGPQALAASLLAAGLLWLLSRVRLDG